MTKALGAISDAIRSDLKSGEPDKTTIELGLTAEVQAGVVTYLIGGAKADGSIKMTLEWDKPKPITRRRTTRATRPAPCHNPSPTLSSGGPNSR